MNFTANIVKRAAASAVVLGALASATALAAAPASAATGGELEVCSQGNYASFVVFPDRHGFSTTVVNAGECHTFGVLGNSTAVESIDIRGIDNASGKDFAVNDRLAKIRPSLGGKVVTSGTDTGQHWAMIPSV